MRVAVISDIHANLHALEAVLEDLARHEPDVVWCLGDLVGYGPRPNECCRLVAERADICLVGNHDLVVLGEVGIEEFNHDAAVAARWTRDVLEEEARRYLAALRPDGAVEGADLFHGSPRDAVWDYVLDGEAVQATFRLTKAPLVLVGHSHVPITAHLVDGRVDAAHAPAGTTTDLTTGRILLNPGSIGQPRDGDPRAAYLLLDTAEGQASFRRIEYDLARTQAEMREAGLPESLAERLAHGV